LRTKSEDANYFKGLIQAAGAFVHLQKQYLRPTHPKDGRRLYPAVRLFRLAEKNLAPYAPRRHSFMVGDFLFLLRQQVEAILSSDHRVNPWKPETAPRLQLDRWLRFPRAEEFTNCRNDLVRDQNLCWDPAGSVVPAQDDASLQFIASFQSWVT
jgi:hypothetical protein